MKKISYTGIAVITTIVFVVLKLTHVIDWSWWWVMSPLWMLAAAIILGLLVVVTFLFIVLSKADDASFSKLKDRLDKLDR